MSFWETIFNLKKEDMSLDKQLAKQPKKWLLIEVAGVFLLAVILAMHSCSDYDNLLEMAENNLKVADQAAMNDE